MPSKTTLTTPSTAGVRSRIALQSLSSRPSMPVGVIRAHSSLIVNDHEAAKVVVLLWPWLSPQNIQECSRREDSDPLVFPKIEEVLITTHDIVGISFNRTFQVAVIRWILRDHCEVGRA